MNVKHIDPHTKRKIKTLPVTGNYLISESDGRLRWAEPNLSWRVLSHAGNQRLFVSNIRFDDTDHSPDLWIYSVLSSDENKAIKDRLTFEEYGEKPKPFIERMLMEQNRTHLNRSRKWYVRQFVDNPDRSGIRRFAGIPFNAWRTMWRRTIALEDIEIYGMSNNQMKVIFAGLNFSVFLKWSELQTDLQNSLVATNKGGDHLRVSNRIMPWLIKNCREGIIPFSDYESMFPSEMDEFIYSVDVAAIS